MRRQTDGNVIVRKARNIYSASRKLVRQGSSGISSFIHGQPALSILTGVAAGFALAMAFRSRE